MEANISIGQYPDMEFMQEFVNKQGFEKWLKDDSAPPFGSFTHLESLVNPDDTFDECVEYEFRVHVIMPLSYIDMFCEGMENRGWLQYKPDPKPIMIKGGNRSGKSSMNLPALVKQFERTFTASYRYINVVSDPELRSELQQRMKG
jgi:hypothetical protein